MVNDQQSSKEKQSFCFSKKKKNLLTRRNFIAVAAGIGAMGVAATGAQKKEDESKMPVWTGDLKSSKKQTPRIPGKSKPNGLNMIVIIADTWRADHLGCYGSTRIKTPYLDKLAAEGSLFTDVTAEGLPTIPCRRVYHTGKSVLPEAKWQPLADSDVTFAQVLQKHGVTTGFIVDTYHHFKADYNFHRGFDSWHWIRGQETDRWKSGPKEKFDPKKHMPAHLWNQRYDANMHQYMMNTQNRKSQEDYFCARSCRAAMNWLEQNTGSNPFMLWIDMFDPHEPWDAPVKFQKMYRKEYPYERYLFGYGVRNADIRPDDLPVIRDLYAAEVTFSDYCIGRLLKRVERLG
ncbi:MAG: sulfatase, partial [Planctomycetota bacterium]